GAGPRRGVELLGREEAAQALAHPGFTGHRPCAFFLMPAPAGDRLDLGDAVGTVGEAHDQAAGFAGLDRDLIGFRGHDSNTIKPPKTSRVLDENASWRQAAGLGRSRDATSDD